MKRMLQLIKSGERKIKSPACFVFMLTLVIIPGNVMAIPKISIGIDQASKPGDVAVTLQILLLLAILSLAPALIIMVTSFTRVAIILSFLRHALGTQQAPPTQVMVGLTIFLTIFIMAPVWQNINTEALQPYMKEKITQKEAYTKALKPLREFMFRQTREKDLALFVNMAKMDKPDSQDEIPTYVLIPSFIISEFRIAFQIGFLLYVPFLMLDMVISSVLMAMGMLMLPPIMISLPFKLILFVLVDGWYLIVGSIVAGFR